MLGITASLIGSAAAAQPEGHATVSLLAEHAAAVPGQVAWIALDFQIDEGWHLYWNGQNDAGLPPEIEWRLPPRYELVGPVQWPAPKRYLLPGEILDHIYEKHFTLLAPLRVPEDAAGRANIAAQLNWLVCKDVCVPGGATVELDLPIAAPDSSLPPADRRFAEARARIPVAIPKDRGVSLGFDASGVYTITVPGAKQLAFFPGLKSSPLVDRIDGTLAEGERLRLELAPKPGAAPRVVGVLDVLLEGETKHRFWAIDSEAKEKSESAPAGGGG